MTETRKTSSGVGFLRTSDERFANLPNFPYEPKYVEVEGLRMAYVEAGPPDRPAILLLHGEPTWGFLYRRMIPALVGAGLRCIAPDLIGFGRSDKPVERSDYTYAGHVAWMKGFLDAIDAPPTTLFAQDWGGLIGLRVAAEEPHRFERIAIANTGLPVGRSIGEGFDRWLQMSQTMPFMDAGRMLQGATQARELSEAEMDAYRAPFPDESYMAGARVFPTLVPITPEHEGVAENLAATSSRTIGAKTWQPRSWPGCPDAAPHPLFRRTRPPHRLRLTALGWRRRPAQTAGAASRIHGHSFGLGVDGAELVGRPCFVDVVRLLRHAEEGLLTPMGRNDGRCLLPAQHRLGDLGSVRQAGDPGLHDLDAGVVGPILQLAPDVSVDPAGCPWTRVNRL